MSGTTQIDLDALATELTAAGTLPAHGYKIGDNVKDPSGRQWIVRYVQNDMVLVTNGRTTTWFGDEDLRLPQ